MGYLPKELIIRAYHDLANLAEGAERTTITSALRYTLAIDAFYYKYNRDCDGKNKSDKKLFTEIVCSFVQLTNNDYVVNFFDDIKSKADCGVGSNLFGGPLFLKSKANPEEEYAYPQNKRAKLFDVKNCVFKKNECYYENLGVYLPSDSLKCALIIWILRSRYLDTTNYRCIRHNLLTIFSEALIESILPSEEIFHSYIDNCSLVDNVTTVEKKDLLGTNKNKCTMFLQKIYYGAPGTGKSNEIKNLTGENNRNRVFERDCTFRTTFHPDSDYTSFVGAYKPNSQSTPVYLPNQTELDALFKMEVTNDSNRKHSIFHYGQKYWEALQNLDISTKVCLGNVEFDEDDKILLKLGIKVGRTNAKNSKSKIVYGFRPQSFLKAYIKAWKNPDKNVALVVEEINRGNCAQIFGDIFQLLDREKDGLSKYPIECDIDMQSFLKEEFAKSSELLGEPMTDDVYSGRKDTINSYYADHYDDAFEKIKSGEILALPMNLSILATMNTSDQSLFPMDSAFKRRWEWIYEPIVEGTDKETGDKLGWKIEVDETHSVDWWKFLQKINAVIYSLTSSEDKQLGYFFCQPDKKANPDSEEEKETVISKTMFVGKVVFYLWNEIFKDYAFEHDVCKKEGKSETLYFADFYDGKNSIRQASLETFFNHLSDFVDKDVNLIETQETDASTETANNGVETPADASLEQSEETTTENTEA